MLNPVLATLSSATFWVLATATCTIYCSVKMVLTGLFLLTFILGKMFHVDFGFILGRDPKPMPPPMKLTSEMINAMGGQNRYGAI